MLTLAYRYYLVSCACQELPLIMKHPSFLPSGLDVAHCSRRLFDLAFAYPVECPPNSFYATALRGDPNEP